MATTTDVYGLTKPAKSDYYDVGVFNDNADIIDETLNEIQNDGGVGTAGLADLSVTAAKLASSAVTAAKIYTGAVTNAKLGSSAVTATKIADSAVTTAKIADAAVTEAKLSTELQAALGEYLSAAFVDELPTTTFENDFSSTVGFVAQTRCTAAINSGVAEIVTGTNAANLYAYAYYDLSDVLTSATTTAVIEYDATIPAGSRTRISLVDLSKRVDSSGTTAPGSSSKDTYDSTGIAFRFGELNTNYAQLQDTTPGCSSFGSEFHYRFVIDVENRSIVYTITESGTTLFTGTTEFYSDEAETVSGIEMYSYVNSQTITFDNLEVTANYSANGSTLYFVSDGDMYSVYKYEDEEPVCVLSVEAIEARKSVYATCSTDASSYAKVATISSSSAHLSNFVLTAGVHVAVYFTYANTSTSNATLNVNGTGARTIQANGKNATRSNSWSAGEIVEFVYTGTYWKAVGGDHGWIGSLDIAELQEDVEALSAEATTTSAGLMSASDKAKLDSFSESGLPVFSETPTEVGEWLDGSSVYRRAFCRELSNAEISAGYVEVRALIEGVSTVTGGSGAYFTVNEHVMFVPFLDGAASPDVLDDRYVALSLAGRYEIPSSNLDGIYGYVDYVIYGG